MTNRNPTLKEYLMVYGWAILLIAIIIGLLIAYGIITIKGI